MRYQIDQSGKIEDTAKDTVLAATNDEDFAVILPAREKRRLQEYFRQIALPEIFVDAVFATALHFLIKKIKSNHQLIVDIEYPGHTKIIDMMLERLGSNKDLEWKLIGKSSRAHDVAYKILKKKLKIGDRLTTEKIWREAKKVAGGNLKIGLKPTNRLSAPANKRRLSNIKPKVKCQNDRGRQATEGRLSQDWLPVGRRPHGQS